MAYLASDLFSGTWENILGPTASWQSDQNSAYKGFTVFVDGYGDENNGASIVYEGNNYYEWGYSFLDSDLDGKLEISEIYRGTLGDENGFTFVSEGYDELVGRYYSSTHSEDRISDSGTWSRNPEKYNGTFTGSDLGIFEIDVELDFTSTENNDLIMGSTNNDVISGNGGDDFLMSRAGNDTIDGGLGNDTIDGGYGNDTAVFSKNFSEYSFALKSGNLQITGSGTDILKNIENIKFNDVTKDINDLLTLANTSSYSSSSSSTAITDGVEVAEVNSSYTADSNGFSSVSGSAPVTITAYTIGQETTLDSIKDYDGSLHAGDNLAATASSYKYQGMLDVNGDGVFAAIFTNKSSKRWVTAKVDSTTGQIDFDDNGAGGGTRVVGIYEDPLISVGNANGGFLNDGVTPAPAQFGATGSDRYLDVNGETIDRLSLNSQVRFQTDLENDNLTAKHSGDYDSDGVHEVYWKTNDGNVYLRSLMHTDGNIRYANYQSEEQMSNYLTNNGCTSVISDIL